MPGSFVDWVTTGERRIYHSAFVRIAEKARNHLLACPSNVPWRGEATPG